MNKISYRCDICFMQKKSYLVSELDELTLKRYMIYVCPACYKRYKILYGLKKEFLNVSDKKDNYISNVYGF